MAGEEIPGGYAGRDSSFGGYDATAQRFAGKERDLETGLGYFGARYFSDEMGRFTSADPGNAGASLLDPQTWNGYSYVRNNPMSLIDPTGQAACPPESKSTCVDVYSEPLDPIPPAYACFFYNCAGGSQTGDQYPPAAPTLPQPVIQPVVRTPPNNGTNDWRKTAACAADFGNKYSIASGVSALTGISKDNSFLSTAFGNDASSISDIVSGRNRLRATISEIFSNPGSKNVLSFAVRGVGAIPTGGAQTAELGVNSAGSYFVKAWNTPTVAGTVVGKTAGAALSTFTKYKAIYDFSVYGLGLINCW